MQAPPVAREPKPGATLYIYTARKAYPSHDALRKPHRERERLASNHVQLDRSLWRYRLPCRNVTDIGAMRKYIQRQIRDWKDAN